MELTELMNAKVSDVVTPHLADDILILKEIQARLDDYSKEKPVEYKDIVFEAIEHISDTMHQLLLLMSREFTDRINY